MREVKFLFEVAINKVTVTIAGLALALLAVLLGVSPIVRAPLGCQFVEWINPTDYKPGNPFEWRLVCLQGKPPALFYPSYPYPQKLIDQQAAEQKAAKEKADAAAAKAREAEGKRP